MQSYSKSRPEVNKTSNLATWHLPVMLSAMTWRLARMLAVHFVSPLALLSRLCPLRSGRVQGSGSLSLFSRSWVLLRSTEQMRRLLVPIPLSADPSFLARLAHLSFILKSSQVPMGTKSSQGRMHDASHDPPSSLSRDLSPVLEMPLGPPAFPLTRISVPRLDQDEDPSALIEVD